LTTARPTLTIDRTSDGVAIVTFAMSKTLNSMTLRFLDELDAALAELGSDDTVRVVVLTGEGRGFSSGHDLGEMAEGSSTDATTEQWWSEQERYSGLILRIQETPKPIIAAVNGPAAGGGLAMALASDIRLCAESARFNAAFVRLGLSGCDVGVSYLLPRIVGPTLAFEMMLTGRLVDAAEAKAAGLVLDVVPDGDLLDRALAVASLITRNSPFGVRMTKQVMWANLAAPNLRTAIELENRTQVMCVTTSDFGEALSAFLEKRDPVFGRPVATDGEAR
jgi:enoyl-CoA hydratase